MIKKLRTLGTYMIVFGAILVGMGLWNTFKERDVNHVATTLRLDEVLKATSEAQYVTVTGGRSIVANTLQHSAAITDSDVRLTTGFYTPVVLPSVERGNGTAENTDVADSASNDQTDVKNDTLIYVVKTRRALTAAANSASEASYTGLLQNKEEIPTRVRVALGVQYPDADYRYLDSTFKPKSTWDRIVGLRWFAALLLLGIGLYAVALRFDKGPPETHAVVEVIDEISKIDLEKPTFEDLCKRQYPMRWKVATTAMWLIFLSFACLATFNQYSNASRSSEILKTHQEQPAKVIRSTEHYSNDKHTAYEVELEYLSNGQPVAGSIRIPKDEFQEKYIGAGTIPIIVASHTEYNLKSFYEKGSHRIGKWFGIAVSFLAVLVVLFLLRHGLLKLICRGVVEPEQAK